MMLKIGVFLLSLLSFCAYSADTITINADAKQPQFTVTLPANATTGYEWTVTSYDQKLLQLADKHYIVTQPKLIGGGGKMIFTFALIKGRSYPKSTNITFTYARPWEKNHGTVQKAVINFKK